jgi:hypothetical protein
MKKEPVMKIDPFQSNGKNTISRAKQLYRWQISQTTYIPTTPNLFLSFSAIPHWQSPTLGLMRSTIALQQ